MYRCMCAQCGCGGGVAVACMTTKMDRFPCSDKAKIMQVGEIIQTTAAAAGPSTAPPLSCCILCVCVCMLCA